MALASAEPHLQFQKWAQEYGPIYSLILGSKVMIVLSQDEVLKALVDKKSAIYSSRPDLYVGGHLLSGGLRMVMEASQIRVITYMKTDSLLIAIWFNMALG